MSTNELRTDVFPSRSRWWIIQMIKAGEFGAVVRDKKGWLVPASGVQAYLERNRVQAGEPAMPATTRRRYHFST